MWKNLKGYGSRYFAWTLKQETNPYLAIATTFLLLVVTVAAIVGLGWLIYNFTTPLVIITLCVAGLVYGERWRQKRAAKNKEVKEVDPNDAKAEPVGWYFDNLSWHWKFRPAACLIAGVLIGLVPVLIILLVQVIVFLAFQDLFFLEMLFRHWLIVAIVGIILSVTFGSFFWFTDEPKDENGNVLVVPGTKKAAMVGWQGMPRVPGLLPEIYLETSQYEWLGKELGFGPILLPDEKDADADIDAIKRKPFVDDDGFFNMGEIQFTVWNRADADSNSPERGFLTSPAKNDAESKLTITAIIRIVNPRKIFDSTNPALDLGERFRQETREFTQNFTDTDIPKLQQVLSEILAGASIVTCFLGKSHRGRKSGSMIRDMSDMVMFELVDVKKGDTVEAAEKRLRDRIEDEAPSDQAALVTKKHKDGQIKTDEDGNVQYDLKVIKLERPIQEVLRDIGCVLVRISVSDADFSQKVKDSAAEASAQEQERITGYESAKAAKENREVLLPTDEELRNPGYEQAALMGLALDPGNRSNVKLHGIYGSSSTTQKLAGAAIVGASELKDDDS